MQKITSYVIMLTILFIGLEFKSNGQTIAAKPDNEIKKGQCSDCGKASCTKDCSSSSKSTIIMKDSSSLKALMPSCNLSGKEMAERKSFLLTTLAKKVINVKELETGYDFTFKEPNEYSLQLLEFINFERSCCSSFSYALIFEPNNTATHLQIYGSKEIKSELAKGFKELGLIK